MIINLRKVKSEKINDDTLNILIEYSNENKNIDDFT